MYRRSSSIDVGKEAVVTVQAAIESSLGRTDPEVARLVEEEVRRQSETICLIPSENYVSRAWPSKPPRRVRPRGRAAASRITDINRHGEKVSRFR
jgi:hypothetical protein